MTTIRFEIISDQSGKFSINLSSCSNEQLNCYITRDQYSRIITKINERMKLFKSPVNAPLLVGIVIIILSTMIFIVVQTQSQTTHDIYGYIAFITMVSIMTFCCGACPKYNKDIKEKRFKKLQTDIQAIADQEFMTVYEIAYAKWRIKRMDDRLSSDKRFKLTAEFLLQQQGILSTVVPSMCNRIHEQPTRSSTTIFLPDTQQTAILVSNNDQHLPYEDAPATPPPPTYHKVIDLFSQGSFIDCTKCGYERCVYNRKYCTQCGHLFSS